MEGGSTQKGLASPLMTVTESNKILWWWWRRRTFYIVVVNGLGVPAKAEAVGAQHKMLQSAIHERQAAINKNKWKV